MEVDLAARIMAIVAIAVSVVSILVTYYLWWMSGPRIRVNAFVSAAEGRIHIEVRSTGRLAATVRRVELRDDWELKTSSGHKMEPTSRWSVQADTNQALPIALPPTSFIEAEVAVLQVFDRTTSPASEVYVRAWAQRGDGKWVKSERLRLR